MLTQTLRTLERDGSVSRSITPSVPVRVDYSLTSLGVTLLPMMQAIKNWAETHIDAPPRSLSGRRVTPQQGGRRLTRH